MLNKLFLSCLIFTNTQNTFGGCLAWLCRKRPARPQVLRGHEEERPAIQMVERVIPRLLNPLDDDYARIYQNVITQDLPNLKVFIVSQSGKQLEADGETGVAEIQTLRAKDQILSEAIAVCQGHKTLLTVYTTT